MCICAMCMQMPWEARRVSNALVLELQTVVSCLMLVLGTEQHMLLTMVPPTSPH